MVDPWLALLRALSLTFQCGLVGGAVFTLAVAGKDADRRPLRLAALAALAAALASVAGLTLMLRQLVVTLELGWDEAWGAEFVAPHLATIAATAGAAVLCALRRTPPSLAALAALAVVATSVLGGHAASREDARLVAVAADFLHQTAAGVWLGGIPYLLLALRSPDGAARIRLCRRFSALAMASVAVLVLTAIVLARLHVGSWAGMVGTDFGATATVKAVLLAGLLLLGLGNLRAGPHLDQAAPLARLRAFATAEIGIGLAVLVAAASLSVMPPPSGAPEQVVPPAEVLARLIPDGWPHLTAAIPTASGGAEDHAWAEVTHHWAGLVVGAMGLLALVRRLRRIAAALVFPAACVLGGVMLLVDGHPNAEAAAALPIHLSHMAIAVLALAAGVGRWIELAGDHFSRRLAAWIWPTAFTLMGIVLLAYRETCL